MIKWRYKGWNAAKTITLTLRKTRGGGVVGYAPFTLELQFMHLDKIPVIRPGAHPPKTPRFSFFQH